MYMYILLYIPCTQNVVKVTTGCTICHKEYKILQNKYSTKHDRCAT